MAVIVETTVYTPTTHEGVLVTTELLPFMDLGDYAWALEVEGHVA